MHLFCLFVWPAMSYHKKLACLDRKCETKYELRTITIRLTEACSQICSSFCSAFSALQHGYSRKEYAPPFAHF